MHPFEKMFTGCLRKIQYSLKKAVKAAEKFQQYFYPCDLCHYWHLTSKANSNTLENCQEIEWARKLKRNSPKHPQKLEEDFKNIFLGELTKP